MQQTLAQSIRCDGISLHKGEHVTMTLKPAPEYHGIRFKRTDIADESQAIVAADYRNVVDTTLCTVLENPHGVRVSTVEHLMAALWACGVDNALIEIDGNEVPVMDGSSEPFIFLIECAGVVEQEAPRRFIRIDTPIIVHEGESCTMITPHDDFLLDVDIEFKHEAIGKQHYRFHAAEMSFKQMLSRARTFGFLSDVEAMRSAGLARGGSLHNAVVINDEGVMNTDGLRYHDECVRHKALDCIGDFYLAGMHIMGHVKASRPGHSINNKLLKAIFARHDAWTLVEEAEIADLTAIAGIATEQGLPARL